MTLSGVAGKVPVGPLRREGLGYGYQPKSVCHPSRLGRRRNGYRVCGCLSKSGTAAFVHPLQNAGCGILSLFLF